MADGERRCYVIPNNVPYGQPPFRIPRICNTLLHHSWNHRFVYTLYVLWVVVFAISTVLVVPVDPFSISV